MVRTWECEQDFWYVGVVYGWSGGDAAESQTRSLAWRRYCVGKGQ